MHYQRSTQVPNIVFDEFLKTFTEAEMKVYFIILRQTYGWINRKTGGRKKRDRITNRWFCRATGLSKRAISNAIASLSCKKLILITNHQGKALLEGKERKGKSYLYFSVSESASQQVLRKPVIPPTSQNPRIHGMRHVSEIFQFPHVK